MRARASRVSTVTSGLDRASTGFFPLTKTLGQSRPTGARGVVMNKSKVSTCLESVSTMDYFIKLTAITPTLKSFTISLAQLTFKQQLVFAMTSV